MTPRRFLLTLALPVLCGLTFWSAPAHATVAIHLDDGTQAQKSDLVAVAVVRNQQVVRGEDGRPFTHTTLEVERSLKGAREKGARVVVRQMGGTLDGKTLMIPGDAHFVPGERVVVFLADREPGSGLLFLTALAQSKLAVVGSAPDGDLILHRSQEGLLLLDRAHQAVRPEPTTTLGGLEASVRAATAAPVEVQR